MVLITAFAILCAIVLAILAFRWWAECLILERALERASPRGDSGSGCMMAVLLVAALLTALLAVLLGACVF